MRQGDLMAVSQAPTLILLVGGNGSGKTTYYERFLKPKGLLFVNADIIAKEQFGDQAEAKSLDAAQIAADTRYRLLDSKTSFCFETVFSHRSKVDFLAQAKAAGFRVQMIAIYTNDPSLNVARVSQRVGEGGHSVPEEKILSRIPKAYEHMGLAIPLCDEMVLLDNSSIEKPFTLKLALRDDKWIHIDRDLPAFALSWAPTV